ncbi:MAG: hypothetical protein M3388_18600 [Acidobacteriota bacterium]|nr:hypothetical protein [Acidobacteriota bacterium]
MNENISTISSEDAVSGAGSEAFKVIVCGGLTIGILDCAAASLNGVFKGMNPAIVWQYVASGLLGRNSYNHGWKSVILGLLIHFFIAFSVTIIYYAASRRLPIIVRRAVLFGILYGITVYFVMAYVVTPLSAAGKMPFSVSSMLIGSLIHVFCIGLPIAFITRRFAKNNRENSFVVNESRAAVSDF